MQAHRSVKILFAMAALATVGSLAAAPLTAPSPQDAITQRQTGFKKMGGAMKALNDQLKGDAPAKAIMLPAAQTIAATARVQGGLFPAGSGASAGIKTDALPGIWTDRATFDGQMTKLVAESAKLVTAVNGGDATAIRAQFKVVGATCGGCHRQFRADT